MGLKFQVSKRIDSILLCALIISFILFKIPYLELPFYWDESWVYGPAVRWMSENGLGLLPDALPIEYGRGHPLLFHLLGGSWAFVFGNSILSLHLFALTISVVLIASVYFIVKNLFDLKTALFACIILCFQPVFFAQSGLVLPEVMLSLFLCWSIYFYLKSNYKRYVLFASCAILIKESAIVLPCVLTTIELFHFFYKKENALDFLRKKIILVLPLAFFIITLLLNYWYYGWFIFPDHKNSITLSAGTVWNNFTKGYGAFLFIYQARNILTILLFITIGYVFYKKQKLYFDKTMRLILLFIFAFLVFSSMNFYSNRYILVLVILFCIFVSVFLTKNNFPKFIPIIALLAFAGLSLREMQKDSVHDHHPGYKNYALAQQTVINWCVKNNYKNKKISCDFLVKTALTNSLSGYVNSNNTFSNVVGDINEETEVIIASNHNEALIEQAQLKEFKKVFVSQFNEAYCTVYKK